jgi:hypothetical protein
MCKKWFDPEESEAELALHYCSKECEERDTEDAKKEEETMRYEASREVSDK